MENLFIRAITQRGQIKQYRVIAKLPTGKIGITGWYSEEVIEDIKKDIIQSGAIIKKVETKGG